jgi:hypothetical protein
MRNGANAKAKALRLIGIANELLGLARQFELDDAGARLMAVADEDTDDPAAVGRNHDLWAELAREMYRNRRLRAKIFGSEALFGEPAWDILLDLFVAAKDGRRVSVMSACIGSAVPSTTALRWIAALEREELIIREDDPEDARRTYVMLTERGYAAMVEYFQIASKSIKGAAMGMSHRADQLPPPGTGPRTSRQPSQAASAPAGSGGSNSVARLPASGSGAGDSPAQSAAQQNWAPRRLSK